MNKEHIEEPDHDDFTFPLWELGWKLNQMIHPIVYSMSEWDKRKGTPFWDNVEKEGVILC